MKKNILIIVGLLLTSMAFSQTASPQLISSSGDSFKNANYQLDWSIGESVTASYSEGAYILTQGFHQGVYTITTELENRLAIDAKISISPNPTTDLLTLKLESTKLENTQYFLTDISGKILQTSKVTSNIEQLNFATYASGIYFLSLKQENRVIKSFKIIKR